MMERLFILALLASAAPAAAIDTAELSRVDEGSVRLSWAGASAVDLYVSDDPAASLAQATRLVADDRDGQEVVKADGRSRRYFIVQDRKTGQTLRVAERILPLERGSNFRDLGGYPGADGKRVRWGKIYRSGAMPLLSDADYEYLKSLQLRAVVDLRSIEEREVAPTELDDRTGALFLSNDYSARTMFASMRTGANGVPELPDNLYAGLGDLLEPQIRAVFDRLLAGEGSIVYHCSAGQDRTGIVSALVLTVLGVPRDVILADYHLSTPTRRPRYEMPAVNPADYPNNPILRFYGASAANPEARKAEPLYDKNGVSHLAKFLAGLDAQHGSVTAYLDKSVGLTPDKVAKLRAMYLE
jgi:protein-tyrosine phosphatase